MLLLKIITFFLFEVLLCGSRFILYYFVPGALYAASGIIEKISGLIGNIVLNRIYAETLHFFKGFVFIILAAMLLFTGALMM